MEKIDHDVFLKKAKYLASQSAKLNKLPVNHEEDFYIVWFAKTLQNWKALVSTDAMEGVYFEVTYSGDWQETYVDLYQKAANNRFADEDLPDNR